MASTLVRAGRASALVAACFTESRRKEAGIVCHMYYLSAQQKPATAPMATGTADENVDGEEATTTKSSVGSTCVMHRAVERFAREFGLELQPTQEAL